MNRIHTGIPRTHAAMKVATRIGGDDAAGCSVDFRRVLGSREDYVDGEKQ